MAEIKNALSFRGVNFSYGTDPVLRDVTFSVPQGEFLIIIGPNGGGKTTLLKLALGLLVPESGTISVFGRKPGEDRSVAGYVPQDTGRNRDFPITALEVVLQGRLGFPGGRLSYGKKDREAAMEALKALKMEPLAGRSMGELSQGQRQRVLIARGLASGPRRTLSRRAPSRASIRRPGTCC
jgi:ABC-type Mn/Zn transport systems, ATPase component